MKSQYVEWRRWIAHVIREALLQQRYLGYPRSTVLLISRHPYLPLSYVDEYKSIIAWDLSSIQSHPEMTSRFHSRYFRHHERSHRPQRRTIAHFQGQQASMVLFINYERRPYRKTYLTYHPKFPLALALAFPDKGWDYTFLLLYHEWSIPQIRTAIRHRRMDWKVYSRNPFLTTDILHEFLRYAWDWPTLATSPCFPPQDIYQDPILMPRWKWRSVFKNPRMSVDFWKQLLTNHPKVVHDPLIILHNRFQYDTNLQSWATFRIHRFLERCRSRRRVLEKASFVRHLSHHLPLDIMTTILSFV